MGEPPAPRVALYLLVAYLLLIGGQYYGLVVFQDQRSVNDFVDRNSDLLDWMAT